MYRLTYWLNLHIPMHNNSQYTWVINRPGADQVRLHFTKMELGVGDQLQLLDKDDNVLATYLHSSSSEGVLLLNDYWSERYALDSIKVKLITNNEGNYYGFQIDQVDPSVHYSPA